eukprot:8287571-Pyramimonas_sp.AAC.1
MCIRDRPYLIPLKLPTQDPTSSSVALTSPYHTAAAFSPHLASSSVPLTSSSVALTSPHRTSAPSRPAVSRRSPRASGRSHLTAPL